MDHQKHLLQAYTVLRTEHAPARLQMESEESAQAWEAPIWLGIKRLEVNADEVMRLYKRELASHRETHRGLETNVTPYAFLPPVSVAALRHILLLPPFK